MNNKIVAKDENGSRFDLNIELIQDKSGLIVSLGFPCKYYLEDIIEPPRNSDKMYIDARGSNFNNSPVYISHRELMKKVRELQKPDDRIKFVIYHKDCMDGLSSAFIASQSLGLPEQIFLMPMHYGYEDSFYEALIEIEQDNKGRELELIDLYLVDFSFDPEEITKLLSHKLIHTITILDHHESAINKFNKYYENQQVPSNLNLELDITKSGAMITYNYFESKNSLEPTMFKYIEDRDLWKWKLPSSKEVSQGLSMVIKPNDIVSFGDSYGKFMTLGYQHFAKIGKPIIDFMNQQVEKMLPRARVVTICEQQFMIVNATENISELGNAMVKRYRLPAAIYFILEDGSVNFSLRSNSKLQSVSAIAQEYNGGGHRDAAGFGTNLTELAKILKVQLDTKG